MPNPVRATDHIKDLLPLVVFMSRALYPSGEFHSDHRHHHAHCLYMTLDVSAASSNDTKKHSNLAILGVPYQFTSVR